VKSEKKQVIVSRFLYKSADAACLRWKKSLYLLAKLYPKRGSSPAPLRVFL